MAKTIHVFGQDFESFKALLDYSTTPFNPPIGTLSYDAPESHVFYDKLLENIHDTQVFSDMTTVEYDSNPPRGCAYKIHTNPPTYIQLKPLSHHYFNRCLFSVSGSRFRTRKLFALLALSGVHVTTQLMCIASSLSTFTNDSNLRMNWFKMLLSYGNTIVSAPGVLIKDDLGNSILGIVSESSLKYLLKELIVKRVYNVHVSLSTMQRFNDYATRNLRLQEYLEQVSFIVIE